MSSCQITKMFEIKRNWRREQQVANRARVKEEKRKEVVDKLVLPRLAKSLQNGAGFSGKI